MMVVIRVPRDVLVSQQGIQVTQPSMRTLPLTVLRRRAAALYRENVNVDYDGPVVLK